MFSWDESKRLENLKKHGVDFQDAALIFENAVLEEQDRRRDYREERWRALGHVDEDYFMVVYTWRDSTRRIISAWRVNDDGKQRYTALLTG
jgi:uncharacterized DUF497 family protein